GPQRNVLRDSARAHEHARSGPQHLFSVFFEQSSHFAASPSSELRNEFLRQLVSDFVITTSDCCCRQMVPPQLLEFGHFRKVLLDKVLSMIAGQSAQPVSQDLGIETASCSSQVDGAGELIDVTARIEGCRHPGQAFLPESIEEGRRTFDWYGSGGMPSSFG